MSNSTSDRPSTPRQLADRFVHDLAAIDPSVATGLGLNPGDDRLPDLSPEGYQAKVDLASSVLAELDALEQSAGPDGWDDLRSEEHTSELQSRENLVCRLLLEKKKNKTSTTTCRA